MANNVIMDVMLVALGMVCFSIKLIYCFAMLQYSVDTTGRGCLESRSAGLPSPFRYIIYIILNLYCCKRRAVELE